MGYSRTNTSRTDGGGGGENSFSRPSPANRLSSRLRKNLFAPSTPPPPAAKNSASPPPQRAMTTNFSRSNSSSNNNNSTPTNRRSLLIRLFFSNSKRDVRQQQQQDQEQSPLPPLAPQAPSSSSTTATEQQQLPLALNIEPLDLTLLFKDDSVNYDTGSIMLRNKHFTFDGDVLVFSSGALSISPNPTLLNETVQLFPLGRGSSSTVHACLNKHTFQVFALKETRILDSVHAVRQAQNEILALQRLKHPNIVEFYSAFLNPKTCTIGIALSYEFGGSVAQLVLQRGALHHDTIRKIARDVALALECTHALKLAHCDVKPANILISRNFERFVLCDFGLARSFAEQELATFTGTTKYMSPERLLGLAYSAPADVWALGLVLCTCAWGRYPLQLDGIVGEEGIFFAVLQHFRERAEAKQPFATFGKDGENEFCLACLQFKPLERPTAASLLRDFAWMKEEEESAAAAACAVVGGGRGNNSKLFDEVCLAVRERAREVAVHGALLEEQVCALADQFQLDAESVRARVERALSYGDKTGQQQEQEHAGDKRAEDREWNL